MRYGDDMLKIDVTFVLNTSKFDIKWYVNK